MCIRETNGGTTWQARLHDVRSGRVVGVAASRGGRALLSAAADGSLLLLDNPLASGGDDVSPAAEDADILASILSTAPETAAAAAAAAAAEPPDITDPNAPCLTEAAAQLAAAQQHNAAAHARAAARAHVADLRARFRQLLDANEAAVSGARLPRSAFAVDAGLAALVEQERIEACDRARHQAAWRLEAAGVQLRKLRAFFTDQLTCERFVVRPIGGGGGGGGGVWSLRACRLAPEVQVRHGWLGPVFEPFIQAPW